MDQETWDKGMYGSWRSQCSPRTARVLRADSPPMSKPPGVTRLSLSVTIAYTFQAESKITSGEKETHRRSNFPRFPPSSAPQESAGPQES